MPKHPYWLTLSLLALATSPAAIAGKNNGWGECDPNQGDNYQMRGFTYYAPVPKEQAKTKAGRMNGVCGRSNARTLDDKYGGHVKDKLDKFHGGPLYTDACEYSIQAHLKTRTPGSNPMEITSKRPPAPVMMTAVPLKGRASKMLGAIYKAPSLDSIFGYKDIYVYAGDTYGKNWHYYECAMDIMADRPSVTKDLINRVGSTQNKRHTLVKVKRIEDLPEPLRKIIRDPKALEHVTPFTDDSTGAYSGQTSEQFDAYEKEQAENRRKKEENDTYFGGPVTNTVSAAGEDCRMVKVKGKKNKQKMCFPKNGPIPMSREEGLKTGFDTEDLDAYQAQQEAARIAAEKKKQQSIQEAYDPTFFMGTDLMPPVVDTREPASVETRKPSIVIPEEKEKQ